MHQASTPFNLFHAERGRGGGCEVIRKLVTDIDPQHSNIQVAYTQAACEERSAFRPGFMTFRMCSTQGWFLFVGIFICVLEL
jgi:hypothetical protein